MKILTKRAISLSVGHIPKGVVLREVSFDGDIHIFESECEKHRFFVSDTHFKYRLGLDYDEVTEEKGGIMNGKYIKRGNFIIGTIHKETGSVSFASQPKVHTSEGTAIAEARRLAVTCPEKKFMVVEVKAIARTTDVVVE